MADENEIKELTLSALHESLQGRMVGFAGYQMAVQYSGGIIKEHNQVRESCGFFDISHMGQSFISADSLVAAQDSLEKHVAADLHEMPDRSMRYSQLLNSQGGILDDLMITRFDSFAIAGGASREGLYVVVNAARKAHDFDFFKRNLSGCKVEIFDNRSLFAVQGPKAESVMSGIIANIGDLKFMHAGIFAYEGEDLIISRSGYSGEDGFEISVANSQAEKLAKAILSHKDCEAIGLGARDSLRLEAGLCLYGHDIDETTSPVEAGLVWSIGKRRRIDGGFAGSERILNEIANKPSRRRVGISIDGRAPAREGCELQNTEGKPIGKITSGGFSPSLNAPIGMGYVAIDYAKPDTEIQVIVRDKPIAAKICRMPFVQKQYKR